MALRSERDSNAAMRSLLADLDRQVKVLQQRPKLDRIAARQLDKLLKRQSQAWSELNAILDRDLEVARQAANLAATAAEKHLLDLLPVSPGARRVLAAGPAFSRSRTTEVARRISHSRDIARSLLVRTLNRQETGKDLARTVKGQVSPRTKGGISYVAKRLVRTEVAQAYHAAQIERAAASPWVKGLQWRVSPDHKGPDVCDLYNRKTYDISRVPDLPHPNCMCDLVPILMTKEEFLAALEGGLFDRIIGKLPVQGGRTALPGK